MIWLGGQAPLPFSSIGLSKQAASGCCLKVCIEFLSEVWGLGAWTLHLVLSDGGKERKGMIHMQLPLLHRDYTRVMNSPTLGLEPEALGVIPSSSFHWVACTSKMDLGPPKCLAPLVVIDAYVTLECGWVSTFLFITS